MTAVTPDYLHLFNVLGLKAICTSKRDILFNFNFNKLNRQQSIQLLIAKTNDGYKIVIPSFITKNNGYFRIIKRYTKYY
jgi:hypothetical protein